MVRKRPKNVCDYSINDIVLEIDNFSVIKTFYEVLIFAPSISLEFLVFPGGGGTWGHDDSINFIEASVLSPAICPCMVLTRQDPQGHDWE